MGQVCTEIHEWIEEKIEKPIEEWENRAVERCRRRSCKWWCLCCNKWFCWLEIILVKVIRWVIVTVGKWVIRIVCEVVNLILDLIALVINLILSIPIIGGIIRTILNWLVEIIWRLVGLIDFFASWAGLRLRKKMYLGLVIPRNNGEPIATEAELMDQIRNVQEFYDRVCNINVIYTGACVSVEAPDNALYLNCNAEGFFSDWWIGGSYFEFATENCRFKDGFRRVIGFGAALFIFRILDVGGSNVGCSMGPTHNYVVIDQDARPYTSAHEIGHACGLWHVGGANNLMNVNRVEPFTLTDFQIAWVRNSRHCVFI